MNTVNIITLWKFEFFFFPISFMFILPFVLTDSWISCVGGKNEQRYGGVAEASVFPHAHGPIGIGISGWGHTGGMKQTKKNYRAKWSMGWAGIHTHNAYARSRTIPKTTNKKKKRVYNVSVYTMAIGLALAHIIRCIRCVYVKYIDLFVVARWSLGRPKNGNCISIYVGCVCAYVPSLSTSMDALLLCSTIYWYPC